MRKTAMAVAALCICALPATVGCSASSATGFRRALDRVAATNDSNAFVMFSDTARLVKISGRDAGPPTGFGALRALGASDLAAYERVLSDSAAIALPDADYLITAGLPPHRVALIAGGQHPDRVSPALTKLGWTRSENRLVAPSLSQVSGDPGIAGYVLQLAQVRTDGADLAYGSAGANLNDIGRPSGRKLSGDARISSLADCLGDVVAVEIATDLGVDKLTAVAVGVQTPKSNTDTAHAVVCAAWADQAAADAFAGKLAGVLATGVSLKSNQKYPELLSGASTKTIGGSQHIVSWQADTPGGATRIFTMLQELDLPGITDCRRLSPAQRSRICG